LSFFIDNEIQDIERKERAFVIKGGCKVKEIRWLQFLVNWKWSPPMANGIIPMLPIWSFYALFNLFLLLIC